MANATVTIRVDEKHGAKDYIFEHVPFKLAQGLITMLHECENTESSIVSSEFESEIKE